MNANPELQIRPILMGGARDFATLQEVLKRVAPGLVAHDPRPLPELLAAYGAMTTRELSEVLGKPTSEILAELEGRTDVRKIKVRTGELWELGQPDASGGLTSALGELVSWDGDGMACDMTTGVCGPVSAATPAS